MILNKENKREKKLSLQIPVHSDFENMVLWIKTICASSNILYATLTIQYHSIKSSLIILGSIHIWRQMFFWYFWSMYLVPTYPNQILYYISLYSKIRCSLTYLPTWKSDVICECSLIRKIHELLLPETRQNNFLNSKLSRLYQTNRRHFQWMRFWKPHITYQTNQFESNSILMI